MHNKIIQQYKDLLKKEKLMVLKIKVSPRMSKIEFKKILEDGTIKLNIQSAPEKGKANKEIIQFLSKSFHVPKKQITILSGETASLKLIQIAQQKV